MCFDVCSLGLGVMLLCCYCVGVWCVGLGLGGFGQADLFALLGLCGCLC